MSFIISRQSDKRKSNKSNFSNEGGSSPISTQMDECEIDRDSIAFGDIVKQHERQPNKKKTISGLIKQSLKKINPNEFIKLSLDKKKCKNLFEEDKLYEFSQRSLNPTQYRIYKKNKQQNSTSPPLQKKHHSNKIMPEGLVNMQSSSNSNNDSSSMTNSTLSQRNSNSQQKNQGTQVSPFVAASFVQLQQSETHVTLLDKLSIDQFLTMAMDKTHLSHQIRKDLKICLQRSLVQPQHYREFFLIGTGANLMIQQNRGYYDSLLKQKDKYPTNFFDKIKQDVTRSFPSNTFSKEEKEKYQVSLENILSAIAIRNPFIHYCQGMNFVGVFILRYITNGNEEETFWIFVQLLETILSLEMYNNPEFFVYYTNMLEEYLKLESPDIYDKIKKTQTQFLMYPFNEIFTIFTNQLHPEISLIIWMNLIVGGQRVLFKSMISLLNVFKADLLKADDFGQFNMTLQTIKNFNDKGEFLKEFQNIYINKRAFNMALNSYGEKQRLTENINKKNIMFSKINTECDINSPICIHIQQMIKLLNRSFSFFIYKTKEKIEPKIIDYFSANKNQSDFIKFQSTQQEEQLFPQNESTPKADFEKQINTENLDDFLVGRFYHMCEIIEQRESGQMSISSTTSKGMSRCFRSPQFFSIKKMNESDNDSQLNLQDDSNGTDPSIFKNSISLLLSPSREKSKTHSSTYSKEYQNSDQLIQDLINQKELKERKISTNYQQFNPDKDYPDEDNCCYQHSKEDNDDDDDGDYTELFQQKISQNSPEILIRPRRRKSINWEGSEGFENQSKQNLEGMSSPQLEHQKQSENNDDNHLQKQQSQQSSLSSNNTVRSRSSVIHINSEMHNMLLIQMAAASQKFSPSIEKQKTNHY